jgi:hypothetical protein
MADKDTYGRKPVVVVDLIQPRCSNRFGVYTPSSFGTALHTADDGDTVLASVFDATQPIVASTDVTFTASPLGVIWEQGGGGTGSFLGVTGTELVWRAGSGADGGDANTAMIRVPVAQFAGLTVNIIVEAVPATAFARLTVRTTDGEFLLQSDNTASGGSFPLASWAGAGDGGIGFASGTMPAGESTADFNGTIGTVSFYETTITFSGCRATGTPKCYQTYTTCGDTENYNTDGSITWRFTRPQDEPGLLYEETDSNTIKTNAIPILQSVTTTTSRINPGASREGESPLGRRATASISVSNGVWDDHVGDFYLSDRPARDAVGFWSLFTARNTFTPGFEAVIYEGYQGQALGDMQSRRFNVEVVNGPDGSDNYTIQCRDPLDDVRGKNAKYPPTSQIDLADDITAVATEIPVICNESELSLDLGNTGSTRFAAIGDEILSYTGWTGTAPEFTLTGVQRGVLNTEAASHSLNDAVQRCARHVAQPLYLVAQYILTDHTTVKSSYIDTAQWADEGGTYTSTLQADTTLPEPVDVDKVLGELCRDGLFSIYWDDRRQTIPLLAVRPPRETPLQWTDEDNIASLSRKTVADERMTRVSVFFGPRVPTASLTDELNYANRRIRVDTEVEQVDVAGGKIFENTIFSRWTQTFGNALLVGASLLLRYRLPPQYLTVDLDAKDSDAQIGDVVDLITRYIRDSEGQPITTRWQIIGVDEPVHGTRLRVELQSYRFVGKFAVIMANDAPSYADATDAEKLNGCWFADDATGKMPDGSEPYLLQ